MRRIPLWASGLMTLLGVVQHLTPVSPFTMIQDKRKISQRPLFQSSTSPETPPIGKDVFLSAVNILEKEISRQTGLAVPPSAPDYVIGKLKVSLSIEGNPGLDLTESGGLVLVTTVEGNAVEAGIKTKDTIVQVSVTDRFEQDCASSTLDHLSAVMEAAVGHAIQEGTGRIDLVLNRLLPIEYMDEEA